MRSGSDTGNNESKEQLSEPTQTAAGVTLQTLEHGRDFATTVLDLVKEQNYQDIEFALEAKLDELDGIKTSIQFSKEFPTGIGKVRDATNAKPFGGRFLADAPQRQINNMLLRALGSMRGIDHTLKFESKGEDNIFSAERESLQKAYAELFEKAHAFLAAPQTQTLSDGEIKQQVERFHKKFNGDLANILISTGLAEGMTEKKEFEELITHYRDLSSVLEPAKSMRTIIGDLRNGKTIIHTDTAHPITTKTPTQLEQLAVMKTLGEGKDFHHSQSIPMQMANRAFHDLIASNTTRLPAQTRKTIAPTIKNGYESEYTIQVKGENTKYTMTSLRCGSMAYVGKGRIKDYSKAGSDPYAHENLAQLNAYANKDTSAPKVKLHVGMLLTEASGIEPNIEHQNEIIEATRSELSKGDIAGIFSLTSINMLGRFNKIKVSDIILDKVRSYAELNNITFPSTATDKRLEDAALIALVVSQDPQLMHITTCASGQDRTGTVDELKAQLFATQIYINELKLHPRDLDSEDKHKTMRMEIAELRGWAGHMPTLASHAVTGSRGMKFDSEPKEVFSKEMRAHYYTNIADTNKAKSMKVDEKVLLSMLSSATKFKECIQLITKDSSSAEDIHKKLVEWATTLKTKSGSSNNLTLLAKKENVAEKMTQLCINNILVSKTLEQAIETVPASFILEQNRNNDKYLPELKAAATLIEAAAAKFPPPRSPSPTAVK